MYCKPNLALWTNTSKPSAPHFQSFSHYFSLLQHAPQIITDKVRTHTGF